jgi:hypothetical protein
VEPIWEPDRANNVVHQRTCTVLGSDDQASTSDRRIGPDAQSRPTDQMVTATAVDGDHVSVVTKSGRVVEQAGTEGP